ncbi:hypothetical protein ACFSHT_10310 [Paraburkholderia silviterrae]|uniref:Uncharacterized protein n=1 Tax=Paraburkholderia silviterrae TaxID=2528715 RepID=A0A4R5MEL2_9BURK|nr:hypothetical protein [Paraburkholderia silviterrae]TDG25344.1 hypothetical protein EYW47_05790 [Paraburkholderia silviterrae]
MPRKWTDDELATVRDIWRAGCHVGEQMHRLPGRTANAVHKLAERLGLGSKVPLVESYPEAILDLLRDGRPWTYGELVTEFGASHKTIRRIVGRMLDQRQLYVSAERGPYGTQYVKFGNGDDEVLDNLEVDEDPVAARARERELDQRYRAAAGWWPVADVAVVSAMHSMVSTGRVGA